MTETENDGPSLADLSSLKSMKALTLDLTKASDGFGKAITTAFAKGVVEGKRFEDVLRIKNAYAVEKLLELDKTEGKLMLTGQGAASEGAAKQLLRDAVSGDLDLASFQQEVGTGQIQWVVEAGTRNIWCRVPGEGDFPLGDEVKYWSARAWLSLEAKLKPQQIETGVE